MPKIKKSEAMKVILDFFLDQGKIYSRSEYIALGMEAPIPYRHLNRYFGGTSYNTVLKLAKRKFPAEWASVGSVMEEPEPAPAPAPKPKKAKKEPAKDPAPSPLDALRAAKGESSE